MEQKSCKKSFTTISLLTKFLILCSGCKGGKNPRDGIFFLGIDPETLRKQFSLRNSSLWQTRLIPHLPSAFISRCDQTHPKDGKESLKNKSRAQSALALTLSQPISYRLWNQKIGEKWGTAHSRDVKSDYSKHQVGSRSLSPWSMQVYCIWH